MRTKTLLLTAALGLVAAATTFAQVYSVNAVGYVNITLEKQWNLIANPLDAGAGNNTAVKLLDPVPDGTLVYKWVAANTAFQLVSKDFGAWDGQLDMTLNPGEAAFVYIDPNATATKITFVGEVKQGTLATPIKTGWNMVASQVPQEGKVATDLAYPVQDGELIYAFTALTQTYVLGSFDFGAWDGVEPTIGVAQGFWVQAKADKTWTRTFSVNP